MNQRYRKRLENGLQAIDVGADFQNDRRLFLTWLLTLVLLGEDLTRARSLLQGLRNRPEKTSRPGADLVAWASLAIAACLLDEPWEREAELGIARIDAALESFDNDPEFLEPAIGLSLLTGDQASVARWRDLRLAEPLGEVTEAVGFETLFLSSEYVAELPVALLAPAIGRIAAKIHQIPLSISAIPHLGALSALARRNGETLSTVLHGSVDELDRLVYGESGADPLLTWDGAEVKVRSGRAGETECRVELAVVGHGRLQPSAHELEPITYLLPSIVQRLIDGERPAGVRRADLRDVARVLSATDGRLEVALALAETVELRDEDHAVCKGRVAVAWEHAQRREPRLRTGASLTVERR
jgi:hypothetical protein